MANTLRNRQQGAPVREYDRLKGLYDQYQQGGGQWQQYGVRSLSMDADDNGGNPFSEDNVSTDDPNYIPPRVQEAIQRGLIRPEDAQKAKAEFLANNGELFYEPGKVRTFDDDITSQPIPGAGITGLDPSLEGLTAETWRPQAPATEWGPLPGAAPPRDHGTPGAAAHTPRPQGTTPNTVGTAGTAPTSPAFAFDPTKIRDNEAYKVRVSDTIKGVDRSAAARGLSFTNQAREELGARLGDLATEELGAEYGRQLGTFNTNHGVLLDDRAWDQTQWGRGHADRVFGAGRDDESWRRSDADRNFAAGRSDVTWGQGRTDRNDDWSRGLDVWNMGRTNSNDLFDQNYRISDLSLRYRPRPA